MNFLLLYSIVIGSLATNFFIKCDLFNASIPITEFAMPLTKAAGQVILKFFIYKTSLISISRASRTHGHTFDQSDIINDILYRTQSQISYRLVPRLSKSLMSVSHKRKFNIIFIDDYESFANILDPARMNVYDVTGYYLVIITSRNNIDDQQDTVQKIFNFAWTSYIINIQVLLMGPDDENTALMYTYFPYTEHQCGDTTPVVSNIFVDNRFLNDENFYPNKLGNFHMCPLYIATFNTAPFMLVDNGAEPGEYKLRGFEGDLLKMLGKRLNFKLVIKIPDRNEKWGEVFVNGTMSGAVRMVAQNEVNLTIGSYGLTQTRLSVMDGTQNYFQSDLVVVTPPGESYSPFEKLFLPFDSLVWVLIGLQFALGLVVCALLKVIGGPVHNFLIGRNNRFPLLSMISVFLGGPMCHIPGRNFARTLVMIWMLGCLVIRTSYQGSLFNCLQMQRNYSAPETIEKIIERDLKFYVTGTGSAYLDSIPHVRDRIIHYNFAERDYYWARVRHSNFKGVLLSSRQHVAYANYQASHLDRYHIAKQEIMFFPVTMYVRQGSYLTGQLNRELSAYISSGLIRHWKNDIIDDRYLQPELKSRQPVKLNYAHIAGGYQLCMIFYAISLFVFGLEILSRRILWLKKLFDFLTY